MRGVVGFNTGLMSALVSVHRGFLSSGKVVSSALEKCRQFISRRLSQAENCMTPSPDSSNSISSSWLEAGIEAQMLADVRLHFEDIEKRASAYYNSSEVGTTGRLEDCFMRDLVSLEILDKSILNASSIYNNRTRKGLKLDSANLGACLLPAILRNPRVRFKD